MSEHQSIVLFDLGGILVDAAGQRCLEPYFPGLDDKTFFDRWHQTKAVQLFETGQISASEFAQSFMQDWPLEMSEQGFLDFFASWVKGFYPGAQEMVLKLRQKHTTACLSNTNEIHWNRLYPQLNNLFDYKFASHEIACMKPNLAIYEHAIKVLKVDPEQIFFFDDLEANVKAAVSLGINAFCVQGMVETSAVLRSLSLLPAQ